MRKKGQIDVLKTLILKRKGLHAYLESKILAIISVGEQEGQNSRFRRVDLQKTDFLAQRSTNNYIPIGLPQVALKHCSKQLKTS